MTSKKTGRERLGQEELESAFLGKQVARRVESCGGWLVGHGHLDRACTNLARFWREEAGALGAAHSSLEMKQSSVGDLHRNPEYRATLEERMGFVLEKMLGIGVRRFDTLVDTTADELGLGALEAGKRLQEKYAGRLELRLGAYNVFGFKPERPERRQLYGEAAEQADFLGTLPERDDRGNLPDHVGFYEHLYEVLELGKTLDKEVHLHLDQGNLAREHGTWSLCEHLRHNIPVRDWNRESEEPKIWAVHVISPSAYEEEKFAEFLGMLKEARVGVIFCVRAALGMLQLRNLASPTHNSIARVLEMLVEKVPVRIGLDNIADTIMPEGNWNIRQEVVEAACALRYYNPTVWAKVASGKNLTDTDRHDIEEVLESNRREQERKATARGERFRD